MANNSSSSASSSPLQARPRGWCALSRQLRGETLPVDPFPSLSTRSSASADPSSTVALASLSYASAAKKALQEGEASFATGRDQQRSRAVKELHKLHNWADPELIEDVLDSVDMNEVKACALLHTMSLKNRLMLGESNSACQSLPGCVSVGKEVQIGSDHVVSEVTEDLAFQQTADSIGKHQVHALDLVEPELEEEDVYLFLRRDALRMSRTSNRHAQGAYKAFLKGDHSRAKVLSQMAQQERREAEKMHAEAARKIFNLRNSTGQTDFWELDLHGLHIGEAVSILQHRLLEIEELLCVDPTQKNKSESETLHSQQEQQLHRNYTPRFPEAKLKVITGIGIHSHGDASLPRAIGNFLLQNGYTFYETNSGVIIQAKFRFKKNE